ncbi:unnamed protein product [Caenorhabditis bovis]|uniref:EGF-like domain-containing protein n=1 Tax=Caenorhabditis bovis TaxID=2654633 RepID=A0A8S1F3S4_9PELO|nr:unnamed protein product [Caenorhabditis bovis]
MLLRRLAFLIVLGFAKEAVKSKNRNVTSCEPSLRLCDQKYGGRCIPEHWICDGHYDCDDKSDEQENCEHKCGEHEFKCLSGICIPMGYVCDGEIDCGKLAEDGDRSDEDPNKCLQPVQCDANEYRCASSPACVHLTKFCDGHIDCPDGSDEHQMCSVVDPAAHESCTYGSSMTLDGFKCYCPNNKRFVNGTCQFVNFCNRAQFGYPPVCTQLCEDYGNGKYDCGCADSRMTLVNGSTCVLNETSLPEIAILTKESVGPVNLADHNARTMIAHFGKEPVPVMCYTTPTNANISTIECLSINNRNKRRTYNVSFNLDTVTIMRFDEVGMNWIFSDGANWITMCKHDPVDIRMCKNIVIGNIGQIVTMAYDPLEGILFYSDYQNLFYGIWKVDVATGVRRKFEKRSVVASSLDIDIYTRTLYFLVENSADEIRAADYDEKYPTRIVVDGLATRPIWKILYAEGKVFGLTRSQEIWMFDVTKASTQKGVKLNSFSSKAGILDMVYNMKNRFGWKRNQCASKKCPSMCVAVTGKCVCQDGSSGPNCSTNALPSAALVVARMRPSGVVSYSLDPKTPPIFAIQNVKRAGAVTTDPKGKRIIVYDLKRLSLVIRKIGDDDEEVRGMRGIRNCEGMAYDSTSDNLYLTDQGRAAITVARLSDLSIRRTIVRGNMTNPRSIVIHVPKSYIFWGTWNDIQNEATPSKIERAKLDGSQRKTLVSRNTLWINGLAIDAKEDYLYWCDAFRGTIERIRFNGADRQVVVTGGEAINHPYGLAFYQGFIYWTEFRNGDLKRYNVEKKGPVEQIFKDNSTIFDLALFDLSRANDVSPCANMKCEHFCFANSCKGSVGCEPARCECQDGFKMVNSKCVPDADWISMDACNSTTHFTCAHTGTCLSKAQICDGDDDCGDGSDEDLNGVCKNFECVGARHRCDGTMCLPTQWVCDGNYDCKDGSDEEPSLCAGVERTCSETQFKCNNTCIPLERHCDGYYDCEDKSDELSCVLEATCRPDEFRCGNGRCINLWQVCDGKKNCRDGLDEEHCGENCVVGRQFRCKSGSACMDMSFRCDGIADCDDGSDESDEQCRGVALSCTMSNQFKCRDGKCIRRSHVCDGIDDCATGEDELNCPAELCDSSSNFVCAGGGKCIPKALECDGFNDCGDNSDESHCSKLRSDDGRCAPPSFRCKDKEFKCISDQQLCDGKNDCEDREDEEGFCDVQCPTDGPQCSHKCISTPMGPVCVCPPNEYLDSDGRTCLKKDPCGFGACSQLCLPQGSSKHCYCHDGFKLQSDRFTCRSDDPNLPVMIYTNRHEIRLLRPDVPGSTPMVTKQRNAIGLDYMYNANGSISVFWSDLASDIIYRGLMEDRVLRYTVPLVSFGVFDAEGIAVDWVTGNVYWIDSYLDTIQVVSPDGLKRATVVDQDMKNARSISLDSEEGLMFWTDWESGRPRVERATLAGNNRIVIWKVDTNPEAGWPNGITCDTIAKRIYWVDARSDSIHTTNYNGEDYVQLLRNSEKLGHPFGIDVFENHVYYSDWKTNTISRVDKWKGSNFSSVERSVVQPFTLRIVHRSKQNRMLKNPCGESFKCNGICLLDGKATAKCKCSNLENPDTCDDIHELFVVADSRTIRGLSTRRSSSRHTFPMIAGNMFQNILSIDVYREELRVLDGSLCHIVSVNLTGNEPARVFASNMLGVSGMAVDHDTGTTYVTVSFDSASRIEAISRDGLYRTTVIHQADLPGEMRLPRDIVFVEKTRKLYWFDDDKPKTTLFSMLADGLSSMMLNVDIRDRPISPVVDQKEAAIYWLAKGKVMKFDTLKGTLTEVKVDTDNATTVAVDPDGDLLIGEFNSSRTIIKSTNGEIAWSIPTDRNERILTKSIHWSREPDKMWSDLCKSCPGVCLRGINVADVICRCSHGAYFVDGRCVAAEKRVFYVTESGELQSVAFEGDKQLATAHALHPIMASQRITRIAVDAKRDVIYSISRLDEIWRFSTNGSFAEQVFAARNHRVAAIALDRVTGYIVFSARVANSMRGVIFVMDPSRKQEDIRLAILEDTESVPYEIAVDPPKGKVFWASSNCVKSANYDGSDVRCLIPMKNAAAIAVDEDHSRLCYVDSEKTAVDCVDYEGQNLQRNVVSFRAQGFGEDVTFAIMGDELYFFDKFNASGSIIRAIRDKNNNFIKKDAVKKRKPREKLRLFDLEVMDVKNSVLFTPCSNQNGGCEHICLTVPEVLEDGRTSSTRIKKQCACVHSRMDDASGRCVPSSSFLMYNHMSSIEFAKPEPNSLVPPNRRLTPNECHMSKIGAIAADVARRRIYFFDHDKNRISAVNFDGTGCFVVADDVGLIPGMAYDEVHQNLYYTRHSPAGIWRINLGENDLEKYPVQPSIVLTLTIQDRPRHLAIHPCRMLIFFSNNGFNGATIERVYFSGYQRTEIIQEDLKDVRGLSIDLDAEKIYFSDAINFRVSRCDYDGTHRETLISSSEDLSISPFQLAIYQDKLIFTDYMRRSVMAVDKLTGTQAHKIVATTEIPLGVVIVDPDVEFCGADSCNPATNNLECEDYCRVLADGTPTCACNGERRLNSDNRTCIGDVGTKACAVNEFACMTSDRCIPYESTCDGYNDCPISDDEDIKYCSTRTCRPGYFACGNGMCIPESKKCNRVNDCVNFADELNCTCSRNEFKCDIGNCIPKAARCDFHQDCKDASDEKGCPFRNCSNLEEHGLHNLINCANTTQCILPSWKCDGNNDCWDGWDEENCMVDFHDNGTRVSPPKECDKDQFACLTTRTCMPMHWRCDGQYDCGDMSDEKGCEKKCSEKFEFTCAKSSACVAIEQKCDGKPDCPDGEDEADCEHNECQGEGNTTFRCTNHRCIPMSWRCDGTDDCMDNANAVGSDEKDCGGRTAYRIPSRCDNETCEVSCQLTALLCDGIVDCADGFDELNCASLDRVCPSNQWMCNNGQCIETSRLCDSSVDCVDGSDEWVEICSLSEPPKRGCPNGWSCVLRNGTIGCLSEKQLCDGRQDCMTGIDEQCHLPQGNCSSKSNSCDQPWNCQRRAGFEKCSCDDGYHLSAYDQTTCLKSPSCPKSNCSHFCIDRRDVGHQCFCAPGYILAEDGKNCRRNDTIAAEIVLAIGHRVKLFTLDGHSKATLLNNLTNGVAVDYDVQSDLIYFTDVAHTGNNGNRAGIVSMSMQPNSFRILKGLPTKGIDGIAIDWLGRNMYYTDRHQDVIAVCDMRGRFQRILLKGLPLNDPRAIVLDPMQGLLFWTDWGTSAHIGKMNMDGSDVKVLLQDRTIRWPNALAVDAPAQRLYFGDAHRDYIGSCDYDGSKRRIVLRNMVRHIFALSVFEDYIYWSDWHNHTVERAHKITGDHHRVLIHDKTYRPMGFKIIHPSLQHFGSSKTARHPCQQQSRCDNLCVLSNNDEGFSCMCAQGFRSEGRSCISECKPLDMVCTGTYKCIASWWRCDGQDDCGDGEDEGYFKKNVCPPFPCEPGQFVCRPQEKNQTGACLYASKLCDGVKDCFHGEDEEPEFCKHFECGDGHFKCADGSKCTPVSSLCDASNDCADGSDETDCDIKDCGGGFFACVTNATKISKCIPNEYYCDGEVDCPQGQDEPETCSVGSCSPQQFRCDTGKCIPRARRCDGSMDCRDGSDEKDCRAENGGCAWMCQHQCMAIEQVCDGRRDCEHSDDEGEEACVRKRLFIYDDSPCKTNICDGVIDCEDGEDEKDCKNLPTCRIEDSKVCDGIVDCPYGNDEMGCQMRSPIATYPFRCNGTAQYVAEWQICDGNADCINGQDERSSICDKELLRCRHHGMCDNRKQCFDITGLCDGIKDCLDGSDEEATHCDHMCVGKFRCTNGRCIDEKQRCDGRDDCGDGSDENCGLECEHFGRCSQHCHAYPGGAECYCAQGYVRKNRTDVECVPASNFTEMFIMNGKKMIWMTLPSDEHSKEVSDFLVVCLLYNLTPVQLNRVKDIELDSLTGSFDFSYDANGRTRLMLAEVDEQSNTDVRFKIVSEELIETRRKRASKARDTTNLVVYDYKADNVYFTENTERNFMSLSASKVFVARANKTFTKVPIAGRGVINSMAIAPEEGLLFWTTTFPVARIWCALLDGAPLKGDDVEPFVERHVQFPRSIVADEPNRRVYWIDGYRRTIESIGFNQNGRRIVKKFGMDDTPMAMDILGGDLFVVTKQGAIHRMHKFTGHLTTFRQKLTSVSPLIALRVANPAKTTPYSHHKNPCGSSEACPSDTVCVNLVSDKTAIESKCLCGPDRVFEKSTRKCRPNREFVADQCGDYFCYNEAVCSHDGKCLCRAGFYGEQCEIDECKERCYNGAKCAVALDGSNKYRVVGCKCQGNFTNYDCSTHVCDGVCGPRGTCKIMECPPGKPNCEAQAYCECDDGWEGPKCQHRVTMNPCASHCFNGGKCTGTRFGNLRCECPPGFRGPRCESCDHLECANSGFCVQTMFPDNARDSRFECLCPPGYDGKSCEIDLCKDACPFGSRCVYNGSLPHPITCQCQPNAASLNPLCLPICDVEVDWCRNGGKCFDRPGAPGQCKCPPRFGGPRCDAPVSCSDYCLNNSKCLIRNATHYECVCREGYAGARCNRYTQCDGECEHGGVCVKSGRNSGICICPKGLGGARCSEVTATSCGSLECANGGVCSSVQGTSRPACICPPGWGGLVCRTPICSAYCVNGGWCEFDDAEEAVCKCPSGLYGDRCQYRRKEQRSFWYNFFRKLLMFLGSIAFVGLVWVGFFVYKSNRCRVFRQFRHSPMRDDEAPVDQFNNPAYLADEGATELVSANTSLVGRQRAAFNNPVFEQEMVPIYNDTVENAELLSN